MNKIVNMPNELVRKGADQADHAPVFGAAVGGHAAGHVRPAEDERGHAGAHPDVRARGARARRGIIKATTASTSSITNMNVKDDGGNSIYYCVRARIEHVTRGVAKLIDPSGNVVAQQSFTDNQYINWIVLAQPGTFTLRIDGENALATTALMTTARSARLARAAGRLTASAPDQKTFTTDISHSSLQLPADADPVGDPVTLDSDTSWQHLWDNMPVADSEGNTYYYFAKEVSASVDGKVYALGASYAYDMNSDGTRIHTVTIENTTTLKEVDVHLLKLDPDDTTALEGAVFTLWEKAAGSAQSGEYGKLEGYVEQRTGADGRVTFSGLTAGDYRLVEDYAPDGYIKINETIDFTIDPDGNLSGFVDTEHVKLDTASGEFLFQVIDDKGVALPATGGPGAGLYRLLGALLIALSGAALVLRRRRSF